MSGALRGKATMAALPDETLEVHEENLRAFWFWIYERQNIYHKRFVLKQPAPWTKNKFLKNFKFTNAYRELDRNSVWLIENVIRNPEITSFKERVFQIILCRLFNNPETFEAIGIPRLKGFNPKVFKKQVEVKVYNKGINPFTNAYLINSAAFPGLKRYEAYCLHITQEIIDNLDNICTTIKKAKKPDEIIKAFMKIHGVSWFIAYEFYCDLDYGNLMKFDQNDYTNVGPGAQGGVRLVFPNKGLTRKSSLEMIYHLRDNQEMYFEQFGFPFDDVKLANNKYGGKLTLREIEHSLCEYQKYWKMKHGVGKQRMKFTPITKVK